MALHFDALLMNMRRCRRHEGGRIKEIPSACFWMRHHANASANIEHSSASVIADITLRDAFAPATSAAPGATFLHWTEVKVRLVDGGLIAERSRYDLSDGNDCCSAGRFTRLPHSVDRNRRHGSRSANRDRLDDKACCRGSSATFCRSFFLHRNGLS